MNHDDDAAVLRAAGIGGVTGDGANWPKPWAESWLPLTPLPDEQLHHATARSAESDQFEGNCAVAIGWSSV